jgi:hypothetical protein
MNLIIYMIANTGLGNLVEFIEKLGFLVAFGSIGLILLGFLFIRFDNENPLWELGVLLGRKTKTLLLYGVAALFVFIVSAGLMSAAKDLNREKAQQNTWK